MIRLFSFQRSVIILQNCVIVWKRVKDCFYYNLCQENPEGYAGVDENFFKHYMVPSQFASLSLIHGEFTGWRRFAPCYEQKAGYLNIWEELIMSEGWLVCAQFWYLRRHARKFKLLKFKI